MRLLSETKLAIDDLYDRCVRRNTFKAGENPEAPEATNVQEEEKTLTGKLHALQYRVLDLQGHTF